jgi:hypothetical protein
MPLSILKGHKEADLLSNLKHYFNSRKGGGECTTHKGKGRIITNCSR